MSVTIVEVDFNNQTHARDLVLMLNGYATDPMGGGEALSQDTQSNLAKSLSVLSYAHSFLCYVDDQPAGLANCFLGFSTFACKPLLNIHDLAVDKSFRGKGISQSLLKAVSEKARALGCCKVTLEVLSGNTVARNAYLKFGFKDYQLDENYGHAQFMELKL